MFGFYFEYEKCVFTQTHINSTSVLLDFIVWILILVVPSSVPLCTWFVRSVLSLPLWTVMRVPDQKESASPLEPGHQLRLVQVREQLAHIRGERGDNEVCVCCVFPEPVRCVWAGAAAGVCKGGGVTWGGGACATGSNPLVLDPLGWFQVYIVYLLTLMRSVLKCQDRK